MEANFNLSYGDMAFTKFLLYIFVHTCSMLKYHLAVLLWNFLVFITYTWLLLKKIQVAYVVKYIISDGKIM